MRPIRGSPPPPSSDKGLMMNATTNFFSSKKFQRGELRKRVPQNLQQFPNNFPNLHNLNVMTTSKRSKELPNLRKATINPIFLSKDPLQKIFSFFAEDVRRFLRPSDQAGYQKFGT